MIKVAKPNNIPMDPMLRVENPLAGGSGVGLGGGLGIFSNDGQLVK